MSLLTVCQNVANEIGIGAPNSVINNTEDTAQRLLRIATKEAFMLSLLQWDFLIKPSTITTVINEPQYSLPADYRSLVPDTLWNETTDQKVYPISARDWGYEKVVPTSNFYDRVRMLGNDSGPSVGRLITLHPTPTAAEVIRYEYYSKNYILDATGTTERLAFEQDSDTVIFDEQLLEMGVMWRTLKSVGQPYLEEKTEYDMAIEILKAKDGVPERLHADGYQPTLSNIPETGFGT